MSSGVNMEEGKSRLKEWKFTWFYYVGELFVSDSEETVRYLYSLGGVPQVSGHLLFLYVVPLYPYKNHSDYLKLLSR